MSSLGVRRTAAVVTTTTTWLGRTRWDALLLYALPCIVCALIGVLVEPFRPVQVLFQHVRILPAVFAPWTPPVSVDGVLGRGTFHWITTQALPWLTRLAQWTVLAISTAQTSSWLTAQLYGAWWLCAILRTLIGFILTRSVGWAAPSMFSSRAGYEGSAGIGPMLIALEIDVIAGTTTDAGRFAWIAALTLVEQMPWTYAAASLVALFITLGYQLQQSRQPRQQQYRPVHTSDEHAHGAPSYQMQPSKRDEGELGENDVSLGEQNRPTHFAITLSAVQRCAIRLTVCATIGILLYVARPALPTFDDLPPCATTGAGKCITGDKSLAHLIILTSPRPRDDAQGANTTLARTIASYTPFLPPSLVTLSVVTGFEESVHPAFAKAKVANPALHFVSRIGSFDAQAPSSSQLSPGHHRDLAGLLRWAQTPDTSSEWTMVIEDDFPLCDAWGWRGLQAVLATLEIGRRRTSTASFARAGWVGTGGSGLILHRSLLPITERLIASYAAMRAEDRIPADLLLQTCAFGENDRCGVQDGGVVISDRMIMHHTGSDDSSLGHVVGASKYACGWRQPAHGREFVAGVLEV